MLLLFACWFAVVAEFVVAAAGNACVASRGRRCCCFCCLLLPDVAIITVKAVKAGASAKTDVAQATAEQTGVESNGCKPTLYSVVKVGIYVVL